MVARRAVKGPEEEGAPAQVALTHLTQQTEEEEMGERTCLAEDIV